MNKLIALLLAATFAGVSINAIAQDKKAATTDKKPTKEQCAKDPKMKGCEPAKK